MLRNTTRLLWISFNPRICWSFLYKALLWIHFLGQLALLSCNRIRPPADTTEPEARMWSHVVGLQQWSWGEEIPPRPNHQLPAPNPTPVHTASLPDFVFLIHLSFPSQHNDGRSVLCGKMLPVERRGELFKPVFSPKLFIKDILNCVPFRGEHAQTGKVRSFQPPLVGHSLPCRDYCTLY